MNDLVQLTTSSAFNSIATVLWFVVPLFLFAMWWEIRLMARRAAFVSKIEWLMYEIRVPRESMKSIKSMEQVFASLYGMYSFGIKPLDKYLDGKVEIWMSFELVGRGGGISFYARIPKTHKNLFESAIYAQYPDAELILSQDYTQELPRHLPNDAWDLWGTGFSLVKKHPYPLRTYSYFEDAPKEEKRIDPLATIFEAMSKLKSDEMVWIQLLFSPTASLKDEGQNEIKAFIEKRGASDDPTAKNMAMFRMTPGDREVIESIERKCSKQVFQLCMRFVYIDNRKEFTGLNVASVMGAFQQFNANHLNALKPDRLVTVTGGVLTRVFKWYKKYKSLSKKRRVYDFYVQRKFGYSGRLVDEDLPVVSIEELATLFHFPTSVVKAPKLQAIQSRTSEAPVNLPLGE